MVVLIFEESQDFFDEIDWVIAGNKRSWDWVEGIKFG